ncbi:MAG: type II toxin-antitoxin system VapC family toxin [Rhodospirillales bacterium]|nr:type II toxin-antitoxin system VapC family toxin [Rhodospirillales bacterium]
MTSVYLDTSALIKLYIKEEGTERIAGIVEESDDVRLIILYLTPIEVRSAIRRREREGDIAAADAERVLRQIEDDCSTLFLTQPLSSPVMEEAARLIDRYPLRAYDALQLAGCLVVREGMPGPVTFVCADTRLCDSAGKEGLAALNPIAP